MADRLGELLVKRNFITADQLKKATDEQKFKGGRLESILVKLGFVKEDDLLSFLSAQYRVPSVKLSKIEINPNVIKLVPASKAKNSLVIPVQRVGPKLTLAMADPSNIIARNRRSHKEVLWGRRGYCWNGEGWLRCRRV